MQPAIVFDVIAEFTKKQKSFYYIVFLFLSEGIFAYLNYHVPRTRREILEVLIKGLQRLEYRGYDSAGQEQMAHKNDYKHTHKTQLAILVQDPLML